MTFVKGVQQIRKRGIHIIYVTSPPYSSAIIGVMLKWVTKKPLIVDFRDPFALKEVTSIEEIPGWRAKINEIIEKWIIKSSDIFIVNTEEVKTAYLHQYMVSRGKTYAVTNGFDFKYLVGDKLQKFDKFTIIYAGLFYFFDKRNDHHTDAFFGGMAKLKSSNFISSKNFQFLYFGDEGKSLYEIGKRYSVEDLVVCNGRKSYNEILRNLKRAHLQLLRISKPMISTKLFEGIALNIPFLATIPTGEVEGIIRKFSPSSYVVTEHSREKIAKAIIDSRTCYESDQVAANKVEDFRKQYSRENLSLKLMNIINDNLSFRQEVKSKSYDKDNSPKSS